jgi:hypothetical protein
MAWTQADFEKISSSIASGVKRVEYSDGRTLEYHSISDMLKARDVIKAELAAAADQTDVIRAGRRVGAYNPNLN